MNLYSLHSNPEDLYGYSTKEYRIPSLAYDLAKKNPGLRPKLEPAIMKDPHTAYSYAVWIIDRRWPEAEPAIMKNPYWWGAYKEEFNMMSYENTIGGKS